MQRSDYSRGQLLEDLRAYLHQLGYPQTPELSAPGELLDDTPLTPTRAWAAWVER
jgi:hypothetical protein